MDDPYCPLCRSHIETVSHVLACDLEQARTFQEGALTTLESELEALSTQPEPTTLTVISVQKDNENMSVIKKCNPNVAKILTSQESIGWEILKYGFIAKDWSAAQLEYARLTEPNHS